MKNTAVIRWGITAILLVLLTLLVLVFFGRRVQGPQAAGDIKD